MIRVMHMSVFNTPVLCFFVLAVLGVWGQQSPGDCVELSDQPYKDAGLLRLFYKLEDVKKVFKLPEYSSMPACYTILDVFEHDCCPFEKMFIKSDWQPSKYPFIVFEGNHRISTSIMSKRFAKSMTASYFSMAPPCMIPYRKLFTPKDLLLRRTFFSLATYTLGYQAAEALQRWPVVVTSYWNHQTIFALTKLLNDSDIPEPGSHLFSLWPEDLIMPDILFYINFLDDLHFPPFTTRGPNNWKPRLLEFYRRLQRPLTIEINTKNGWAHALKEVQGHVIKHLGSNKSFSFRNFTFKSHGQKYNRRGYLSHQHTNEG